jgi:murein DD-endopeptidase MepM/ murein hydrolase activator NlpD
MDGLSLIALIILAMMGFNLLSGQGTSRVEASACAELTPTPARSETGLRPPYEQYILTQGPHGQDYGHLAVDLTAGQGALILSPLDGSVTAAYVDDLGNTTLIIENERYQVTLLHGDYRVHVGESVQAGQPVGYESNHGYTIDARGVPCWGRDCGYHTHLNIYDKASGLNVNPLEVWDR